MTVELIANSPIPGTLAPITTLATGVVTTPAAGTQETWTLAASPPAELCVAGGQFRFICEQEILIDITGATGTTRTVLRGQEGSTVSTHPAGAAVYHDLTAGALNARYVHAAHYDLGTDAYQNLAIGTTWASLTPGVIGTHQTWPCRWNTAVGSGAGASFTTDNEQTALGYNAMGSMVNGLDNVAVGSQSMANATGGSANVAVGHATLLGLTGGVFPNTTNGVFNTAIGDTAMQNATTGYSNTAVGSAAMSQAAVTGDHNVAIGESALQFLTSGGVNVAAGASAGNGIVTGTCNTLLGALTGSSDGTTATTDVSSATLLGEHAQSQLSNVIVLGKAVTTRPNLCFGAIPSGAGFFGNGVGVFFMANAATNPSANPTGGGVLYVDSGALKYRGSSGTVTTVAAA